MKKRMRHGGSERQTYWEEAMRRWKESSQSVRAFCRNERVRESAFYFWRRELAQRSHRTESANGSPLRGRSDLGRCWRASMPGWKRNRRRSCRRARFAAQWTTRSRTGRPCPCILRTAGWTSTTTKARTRYGVCALDAATGFSVGVSVAATRRQFTSACWPRASDTATTLGSTSATCSPACQHSFPRRAKNNFSPCCPTAGSRPESARRSFLAILRPPLLRVPPDAY